MERESGSGGGPQRFAPEIGSGVLAILVSEFAIWKQVHVAWGLPEAAARSVSAAGLLLVFVGWALLVRAVTRTPTGSGSADHKEAPHPAASGSEEPAAPGGPLPEESSSVPPVPVAEDEAGTQDASRPPAGQTGSQAATGSIASPGRVPEDALWAEMAEEEPEGLVRNAALKTAKEKALDIPEEFSKGDGIRWMQVTLRVFKGVSARLEFDLDNENEKDSPDALQELLENVSRKVDMDFLFTGVECLKQSLEVKGLGRFVRSRRRLQHMLEVIAAELAKGGGDDPSGPRNAISVATDKAKELCRWTETEEKDLEACLDSLGDEESKAEKSDDEP